MKLPSLAFALLLLAAAAPAAETVAVAAAADLNHALPELAAEFQKQTGNQVKVSYGSSGNLFAQIQNGAPFDVFLSADINYPKRLEESGQAQRGSTFAYAVGHLVLWAPKSSKLDLEGKGLQALLDPAVKKIALANPKHAPYGRAAQAAMQAAGVWDKVQDKLVLGENIAQAAQFAQSGNVDVGVLALSVTKSAAMQGGRSWQLPANLHPPLEQGAALLKPANPAARQFLEFLKSEPARAILKRFGFDSPAP